MGDGRSDKNKRNRGRHGSLQHYAPRSKTSSGGARGNCNSPKLGLKEKEGLPIYNVAGLFLSPLESLKHHFKAWREERRGYKLASQMTRSLMTRHCGEVSHEMALAIAISIIPALLVPVLLVPAMVIGIERGAALGAFAMGMRPFPIPPALVIMLSVVSGICVAGALLATIVTIVLAPIVTNQRRDKMAEILGFESRHEMCRVLGSSDTKNIIRAENVSNCMKLYEVAYEVSNAKDHGASAGVNTLAWMQIDGIVKRAPGVAVKLAEEALRKHGLLATEVTQGGKDFLCNSKGDLLKYDNLKDTSGYEACFDTYFSMIDEAYNFMHESKTEDWGNILNSDRGNMNDGARIMMECMERARPTKDGHQLSSVESSTLIHVDKETIHKPFDETEKDSNVSEKD